MFSLYQKAFANLPLTPAQRALLKAIQSLLIAGVTAVLALFSTVLISNQPIHLNSLLLASAIVAGSTILHGIAKLMSASNDPQLQIAGAVTEKVAESVDTRFAPLERYDAKGVDPVTQDTVKTQALSSQQIAAMNASAPTSLVVAVNPNGAQV